VTLLAAIAVGLRSSGGEELFLSSKNGETDMEILEREIQELEEAIAKL
jgi:hypothetical protein